jgi:hypothetical protein
LVLFKIRVLDHLIVAADSITVFAERGSLEPTTVDAPQFGQLAQESRRIAGSNIQFRIPVRFVYCAFRLF